MQKSAYQSVQNRHFSVVIVTGLSGAGKSTALKVFEDMGFFCVDGLPLSMISRLVFLFKTKIQGTIEAWPLEWISGKAYF